jgi:hypothetical protein
VFGLFMRRVHAPRSCADPCTEGEVSGMPQYGTRQLDIREQNVAFEKVLAATDNPRHRYLLQSYLPGAGD